MKLPNFDQTEKLRKLKLGDKVIAIQRSGNILTVGKKYKIINNFYGVKFEIGPLDTMSKGNIGITSFYEYFKLDTPRLNKFTKVI
jgi:hypothetical protein